MDNFMKNYSVELPIRKKIFKNFDALSKKYEEERIFNKSLKLFTSSFKENIFHQIFGPILKKAEFLSKNFSKNFLKKLVTKIKINFLAPNEIIFKVQIIYFKLCIFYLSKLKIFFLEFFL